MSEQTPLPKIAAFAAVARSIATTARLLMQRRIHHRQEHLGNYLRFADGTKSRVYRETVVDRAAVTDPCVLVVAFRLYGVHGRGHAFFRWESLVNTPLFVGFPGFVSKLWLANDAYGVYRGVYEWDGPDAAKAYARALWRVLELVSVPGSIRYHVVPSLHRDQLLADPPTLPADNETWWRPVARAAR
ncbi:hypothetical protein [Kribbella sp. NPDC048928]|uniref:hypothetical protein n=1 Tax=Kribbella sp. NPDC048928 TaxID=3364111 RepID=UPI0037171A95